MFVDGRMYGENFEAIRGFGKNIRDFHYLQCDI